MGRRDHKNHLTASTARRPPDRVGCQDRPANFGDAASPQAFKLVERQSPHARGGQVRVDDRNQLPSKIDPVNDHCVTARRDIGVDQDRMTGR